MLNPPLVEVLFCFFITAAVVIAEISSVQSSFMLSEQPNIPWKMVIRIFFPSVHRIEYFCAMIFQLIVPNCVIYLYFLFCLIVNFDLFYFSDRRADLGQLQEYFYCGFVGGV